MDTAHETRPPGGPPPPGSRPPLGGLTRATDDTVVSGLCGGLGRHFGIDPLVFRIAFVVMSLAGGTGVLLYLVGWALVPDDDGQTFGARWLPGKDRSHKLLAAGLAGVGLLLLIDRITDGGDDFPLGLVLVALGGAVLWSRRNGRTFPPPPTPGPSGPSDRSGPAGPPAWAVPSSAPPSVPGGDVDRVDPTTPDASTTAAGMANASIAATADTTTPLPAGSSSSSWVGTSLPPVRPTRPPKPPKARSALVAVTFSLLAILAGVVALAGVDLVTGLALALFLVAGALIVGAWRGRARGLLPIAVLLGTALFVATLLDVPFQGGAGERRYEPASVAELRSPYRLVAGELRLDLHDVGLTGQTVPLVASVATGNIVVIVPATASVDLHAHVGGGDMILLGREWSGVDVDERVVEAGREGAGRLTLDLRVGFGQVEVRRAAA